MQQSSQGFNASNHINIINTVVDHQFLLFANEYNCDWIYIAHDCRFDFSSQTLSTLSNFTIRLEWSAFAGYFCQAHWLALRAIWRLGQPGVGCVWLYSFAVLNNGFCCEFVSFSVLSPECPIIWSGSTLSLLDKFSFIKPFRSCHHPLFSSPDTVNFV